MLFFVGGVALGWGYFVALRHGVKLYVTRRALLQGLCWMAARLAVAAGFFAFAVRFGAWAPLGALIGFLGARQIAMLDARRRA